MPRPAKPCPVCDETADRRDFFRTVGVAAAAGLTAPLWATPRASAAPTPKSAAETAVKALYESLTAEQKGEVCFAWDHVDAQRKMPLRAVVTPNWQITKQKIRSDYYTTKQQ